MPWHSRWEFRRVAGQWLLAEVRKELHPEAGVHQGRPSINGPGMGAQHRRSRLYRTPSHWMDAH